MIFWESNFCNFSELILKINFNNQLHVTSSFILSIDNFSHPKIHWDMPFPKRMCKNFLMELSKILLKMMIEIGLKLIHWSTKVPFDHFLFLWHSLRIKKSEKKITVQVQQQWRKNARRVGFFSAFLPYN